MRSTLVCHIEGAAPFDAEPVKHLRGDQLTVGRGSECDWVLTDPDRVLSKQHCVISRTVDGFVLTDTSTNGVFMDGARTPVGRAMTVPLSDGQIVLLGPYRVRVSIGIGTEAVEPALPPALAPTPEAWIGDVPAAGFGHGRAPVRLAWDAPPDPHSLGATGRAMTDDAAPLSTFAQRSEAASPLATMIRIPVPQAVLPTDWDAPPLEPAELRNPLGAPRPAALPTQAPLGAAESSLIEAFTAGAGLPPGTLDGANAPAAFREFGRMLRTTVLGLRELLAARKLAKAELRVPGTAIRASDNNALKLSPDAERALLAIAGQPLPGFLSGADAIEQGIRDVKAHELALVATMSLLLNDIAAQLDPEAIKSRVGGGWALGSASRRARCWDRYEEAYAAATGSAPSLMARFASVYAEQIAQTVSAVPPDGAAGS